MKEFYKRFIVDYSISRTVDMRAQMSEQAPGLQLPAFAATKVARTAQHKVIALVGERCTAFAEGD